MTGKKSAPTDNQPSEKVGEFVSIFKRNETWHADYQHGRRQIRKSLRTRSKKEARRKALIIEKELLAGDHQAPTRAALIDDVIDDFLASRRAAGRAEKTIGKYAHCFRLVRDLAERRRIRRIDQIDLRFVDAFQKERVAGGAHLKTVRNDLVTIKQLAGFAYERELVGSHPLRKLTIPKTKRTPQPFWSRKEVERILEAAASAYRDALLLLADSGMRVGELKFLTWEDVDFANRVIHIRPKDGWTPKTGSQRVFPMTPAVEAMLRQRSPTAHWVFTAPVTPRHPQRGRQISERRLLQYLKRILKKLNLKGHLHTFKHSFVSHALTCGVPRDIVRNWVGTISDDVLDFYTHISDAASHQAMRRLAESNGQLTNADAEFRCPKCGHQFSALSAQSQGAKI